MFVTREFIRSHKKWLFVFGDNLIKRGYGGQAKACRGEPNTLGIPTKRYPTWAKDAFFTDNDYDEVKPIIQAIINSVKKGDWEKIVILPYIGEGRAQLPTRAPRIYEYVVKVLEELGGKDE